MSQASVIFIIVVIVLVAVAGVVAVAFERPRVRENASPYRIPARFRLRRNGRRRSPRER